MDLFEKCYNFTLADEYRAMGIYPYFHALESRQDVEVFMEGKRRIMLGSNNYLGLTVEPSVVEAGIKAFEKYGTGCSGSRFLNGTLQMHLELEAELADFVHKEGAVTFSTGFQSNLGIISALVSRGDYVICDRENHASIYDGCKLSYGKMLRYHHNDMAGLESILQRVSEENAGILVVTDGVFSMSGDIANLPEIVPLAKKYGARVMVDDAHGLGVIGEGGRGTASYFGLEDEVDVPATSAWRTRWTSSWAPSPSPWPASAATWRPRKRSATMCAIARGPSSSPPPSRPPPAPWPWRPCATSRPIPSCRCTCRSWPPMPARA